MYSELGAYSELGVEAYLVNNKKTSPVKYFHNKLRLRYSTGMWMHLYHSLEELYSGKY